MLLLGFKYFTNDREIMMKMIYAISSEPRIKNFSIVQIL